VQAPVLLRELSHDGHRSVVNPLIGLDHGRCSCE
jgi:hypothetical protein